MNYYALLVVLVLAAAVLMHGNREKNLKFIIVASLLLFAIYGLRDVYHLGSDSKTSYLGNFWRVQGMSWKQVIDRAGGTNVLFHLMTKAFCSFISTDYQLYTSLIAVFVSVCFAQLLYRYSPDPLQSILYHLGLLLFTFHFDAFKQSIAMAILMLAFNQIVDKKPVKFLLLVLIAGQFHFPAFIFLPMYWVAKIHPGRGFLCILGILLLLTYIFRNQLLNFMLNLYKEDDSSVDISNVTFFRTKALIMLVIVIAAMLFRIPSAEDRVYGILLEFMGFAIVFQTFCGYNNIFERLADYFFQFSVIFIPMVFDKNATRQSLFEWRFLHVADDLAPYLFCGFGVYRFITTVTASNLLYPFRFFFQS